MKEYLAALGLSLEEKESKLFQLYCLRNPDGTPRWIWNAENPNPDFLRFYALTNWRSKAFAFIVKWLFFFNIQHLIFGRTSVWVSRMREHSIAPYTFADFAVFTGTEGPNRKLVLLADGEFIKIALNEKSTALIEQEFLGLSQVASGNFVTIPTATKLGRGMLALSDLGLGAKRECQFTALHAAALIELYAHAPFQFPMAGETPTFKQCLHIFEQAPEQWTAKMPRFMMEKLRRLAVSIQSESVLHTWAHRDFTSWNCFVSTDKICLYDFELAHPMMPFGYDAFHFVLQQGILVDRLPWKSIKPKLKTAFALLAAQRKEDNLSFELYLKAYLVLNSGYYLKLYNQQAHWHRQVYWLLNVWNDAISDVLAVSELPRPLIIGDIFDFLNHHAYATVKFPHTHPAELNEYSDIDIVTDANTVKLLKDFLGGHSLVKRITTRKKSTMLSMLLHLSNGQVLALDLIWKLRSKAIEFMSIPEAIWSSEFTPFGVRTLNQKSTQEYLLYFYGLNGSAVPQKYTSFFDEEIHAQLNKRYLRATAHARKENRGFSRLVNQVEYLMDVVQKLFDFSGLVLTFSGVDGAGKSTMIVQVKTALEKKLRRKVVVIRHRPSLLPILSAFTKGKDRAEQEAGMNLPRQGANRSFLSSLFRFSYYYMDYLVGQFYIQIRYVMRGEVVLYDRYYFDIINDSLRSNIRLPKWLTRSGYSLLIQPHLNFFLYADAQTILARKKELDESTITELTHEYLTLFSELEAKSQGKYFPIENIKMDHSLQFILNKVQAKVL
jgi:thymidylate kinase